MPAERVQGDVPGRVMITVMTAAPVLAILIPFLPEFIDANTATGQFVVSATVTTTADGQGSACDPAHRG